MSKKILTLSAVALASFVSLQAYAAPMNAQEKLSYTIGFEMGQNFKDQKITIDSDSLIKGLKDGLSGNKPLLDKAERKETVVKFQKQLIEKQEKAYKTVAAKNAAEGKAFLEKNAQQPGVKTLSDGLQYKVLVKGDGAKPTLDDTVTVNYSGQFLDGQVFDSSYKRGEPTTFAINQVIKGWQQILTMMPVGSTWEVVIPAKLAYGDRGMGSVIGPNETLKFKIQLISIKKKS